MIGNLHLIRTLKKVVPIVLRPTARYYGYYFYNALLINVTMRLVMIITKVDQHHHKNEMDGNGL